MASSFIGPALIVSGTLGGEMRPLTPDEKLIMAVIPIAFAGVVTFVIWAMESDSKVAQSFFRLLERINDFLTFEK